MRHLAISIRLAVALALLSLPAAAPADDATVADSKHYSVDFESVRVVRIEYGPREHSVMHDHSRDGVLVYLTDHRVKFTYPDGRSEEVSAKAGQTAWATAGTHLPENLESRSSFSTSRSRSRLG